MGRPSQDDVWVGKQVAERYRLDRVIGKGGMGTVYEAVHLWTNRSVAVKLLWTEESETMSKRILAEARAAAAVRHPNLVEVLDVGAVEYGLMYLVLELLEGESLHSHLRRRTKMRAEDALDVIVPILDALEALHRAHVVHRDVKPGNIFLSRDGTGRVVPKLLDLGISKRLDAEEALTVTGALMGTPSYMSPEQARGAPEVGASADVWAIGVVLFECLTGKRPFDHTSIPGLLHQIATERPPPVASLADDLPGAIANAVDRALAYDPADRHATAGEMADALVNAALGAGWPLTCRIPAGPMISLVPEAPSFMRDIDPNAMTPMSDPDATPFGVSLATPLSPRAKPAAREATPAPASRTGGAPERSAPSRELTQPREASEGRDASVPPEAAEPAPPADEPIADEPIAPVAGEPVDDAPLVLPTRSSRVPWIAAAAVALAALAGLAYWQLQPDPPTAATSVAADGPSPDAPDPTTPPEPAVEPPEPVASTPAPDAGLAVELPAETATAEPARPHREHPGHRPTPGRDDPEPRTAPTAGAGVQEGANRAPIILD